MPENFKLTPMLKQYLQIKEEHADCLLFFRMGDFYELFFEDAQIAARELQIALTSRNPDAEQQIPMCGVPHHSVEEYLRPLLEKKYKIAICDQVEDPSQAKGLVKRAVTRVLTPGTVVEETGLKSKTSNYLGSIYFNFNKKQGGACWIDFSTGEWSGLSSKDISELWQWLGKLKPREILCPENFPLPQEHLDLHSALNQVPNLAYFDLKRSREKLCSLLGTADLSSVDLEDKPELTQANGAIIAYLQTTQKCPLEHIQDFKLLNLSKHLILDEVSERNLELFQRLDGSRGIGTLWQVLDHTLTPMGARLLQNRIRHPWRNLKKIKQNQKVLEQLYLDPDFINQLRDKLDQVFDLERLSTRIYLNRCSPKDFISLRDSLSQLPGLKKLLEQKIEGLEFSPELLQNTLENWNNLKDLHSLLASSLVDTPPSIITEGGLFKSGYDPGLDELLELAEHGQSKLKELLEKEQKKHNLPKLKLGFNKVFGYYLELTRAHKDAVPEHFQRRQTLVNSERYITKELKELEEKIFSASEKRKNLEYELFQKLREKAAAHRENIQDMAGLLAELDYWQALAQASLIWGWSKPEIETGLEIQIEQGRHPAIEAAQGKSGYIPNDVKIDGQTKMLLITGPNMAGKSTVLRQTALICILAHMGSFVPAKRAKIGIVDRIFTRIGASDNLAQGRSTFMVEMTETARILRQAGKKSLVILDEIGRGTSTYDGLSLAWSVVENLLNKQGIGVRTLFATHYHELTELEQKYPGLKNYNIAVKEWKGEIIFLRRLVPGPADRSYGIEVAKLAGVPQPAIQRAKEILEDLEKKSRAIQFKSVKKKKQSLSLLPGLLQEQSQTEVKENRQEYTADSKLIKEISELDLENITPLQALNLLYKWKKKFAFKTKPAAG